MVQPDLTPTYFWCSFQFHLISNYLLHYYCFIFPLPNLILSSWTNNDVYTVYCLWCIFGFTILKSEISLDFKSVIWQCIYRQCAVGLCSCNSAHGISTDDQHSAVVISVLRPHTTDCAVMQSAFSETPTAVVNFCQSAAIKLMNKNDISVYNSPF